MRPIFIELSKRRIVNLSSVTRIEVFTDDMLILYIGSEPVTLSKAESEKLGDYLRKQAGE